jgi:hypothetical protein
MKIPVGYLGIYGQATGAASWTWDTEHTADADTILLVHAEDNAANTTVVDDSGNGLGIVTELIESNNTFEIEIELKPASFVKGLMTLWFAGVSFAFISTLFGAIFGETPIHVVIFPLFMLLMGFGILKFGFSTESENSKKDLIEVLQAKVKK